MKKKCIGIILSGCGYLDGSEINEVVLTQLALDRYGINYKGISLNKVSHDIVCHLTGKKENINRNILQESARILRGNVVNIEEVNIDDYDGFIIPGGFGSAKNLCSFAIDKDSYTVEQNIYNFIKEAIFLKKSLGFMCISPVIIPLLYPNGVKMTIGSDEEIARVVTNLGAEHIVCKVDEICYDKRYNVISTPAYMVDESIYKVSKGIDRLVKVLVETLD